MNQLIKLLLLFSIITSTCVFSMEERGSATLDNIIKQFCVLKTSDNEKVLERVRNLFDEDELGYLIKEMGELDVSDATEQEAVGYFEDYLISQKLEIVLQDAVKFHDITVLRLVIEHLLKEKKLFKKMPNLVTDYHIRNVLKNSKQNSEIIKKRAVSIFSNEASTEADIISVYALAMASGLTIEKDIYDLAKIGYVAFVQFRILVKLAIQATNFKILESERAESMHWATAKGPSEDISLMIWDARLYSPELRRHNTESKKLSDREISALKAEVEAYRQRQRSIQRLEGKIVFCEQELAEQEASKSNTKI